MQPFPIRTERLILRPLAEKDLPTFQAYRSDPQIARYQSFSANEADAVAFFARQQAARFAATDAWYQIAIALASDDSLAGDVGVQVRGGEPAIAEIGFTLARDHQGRGLGTEAVGRIVDLLFDATTVERVEAITDTRNEPSIRLLCRLGMRLEGTAQVLFKGEPCAESKYAVSREVWLARPSRAS